MKELLMLLGAIGIVLIIIFVVVMGLVVYGCCVVSSRCSRREEKEAEELTELESAGLEYCKDKLNKTNIEQLENEENK